MAAAELAEVLRFDAVQGWPAPEERREWFGDPASERALLDAYRSGRMHHAWLIGGPKGIGKATLAYRFARFLLAHPDPADPQVAAATDLSLPESHPAFRKVMGRSHPNLLVLERPFDERTTATRARSPSRRSAAPSPSTAIPAARPAGGSPSSIPPTT